MNSRGGSRREWLILYVVALFVSTTLLFLPVAPAAAKPTPHGGTNSGSWRVLTPVTYKNLTLFPIHAGRAMATDAYITLDEGIRNGTVIISERGSAPAVAGRRGNPASNQVRISARGGGGENASVNQLSLVNRSGKKLLLLAGEVIVGGKQDRIVEQDLIVPPVSVPISLNVFCVEHGRWSTRAPQATHNRTHAPRPSDSHNPRTADVVQPRQLNDFSSLGAISHPKLRAAAQDKKEQGEVWKEVSANNHKLGTANDTDTYQEVYTSKKVVNTMEDYVAALQKEVLQPGVIGVVVARNGQLVWVDAFASQELFARYWPKLLKSYIVDALGEQEMNVAPPTVAQARQYLYAQQGAHNIAGRAGVYRLTKTEHAQYAVFKLEDISLPAPLRLHFNKMNR